MYGTLKLKTAATTAALTLAEAQSHCRVTDAAESVYLDSLLKAATQHAERITGRAFVTQTWYYYLHRFPSGEIKLPLPPCQSVTAITYTDSDGTASQTLSSALYELHIEEEPAIIVPAYGESWPSTYAMPNVVRIEFVAGYGAVSVVPAELKQLMLEWVELTYEYRGDAVGPSLEALDSKLRQYWHGWEWV